MKSSSSSEFSLAKFSLTDFLNRHLKTEREKNIATAFALLVMMLFVCALSYFFFLNMSLRLDESQSLWQTSHTPLSIFNVVAQDVHVPLYHELLYEWRVFIGNSVQSVRVLSLIFFLLAIPSIYILGKNSYNRSTGIWAAVLLSISPFMNWYGNETRMYTLFLLMVILNQIFFLKLWKNPGRDTWFWYAITALLGIFSHYFFFLVLAAQALFYFLRPALFPKGTFVKFVTVAVILLVCFAPWVAYVVHIGQILNQTPTIAVPTTVDLFGVFQQFVFGFDNDGITTVFLSLWPIALVFGFLALQRHKRMAIETEYNMLAIFVPVLLAFGVSFVITPVFISRYLILVVPSLYLCILALFDSFPVRFAAFCKYALVLLMLVMLGVEIFSATTPVKENYLEASEYLNTHVRPQDAVIISAPFTLYPIEYYYHGTAPVSTLPIWNQFGHGAIPPFSEATLPQQVASSTEDVQDVWLLLSYNQGYQQNIQDYFDSHYQRLYSKTFSPGLTLYVYKIRYDAPLSNAPINFN
jgi:uncharacterized membrane protein